MESLAFLQVSLSSACIGRSANWSQAAGRRHHALANLSARSLPRQKQSQGPRTSAAEDVRDVSTGVVAARREFYAPPSSKIEQLLSGQRIDAAWQEFTAQASNGKLPPAIVCDDLIFRLCSKRRFKEARQAYRIIEFCGPELRYNTYQALLNACLATNDVEGAVDIFRDMQNGGMAPNKVTYCGLISALGKQRRRGSRYSELAYDLWQELQRSFDNGIGALDAVALRTGMKACVDVGKVNEAERLLQQAIKDKAPAASDVRTYNILLKGYAMNGNRQRKLKEAMDKMRNAKVKPSSVTYNILIDSHVRAGDLEAAKACMGSAVDSGVGLDAFSYTSLVKGFVQTGDMAGAIDVLEDMQKSGVKPTYITYSTLIDGYARNGNLTAASELLQTMIKAGEQPSAVTYNSLLRGYANNSEPNALRKALELLDDMQSQGVAPAVDTFNTLMSAALAADDGLLAIDLYQRMLNAGLRPDGVTFTVLLQAHASLGQVSEAVAAFESMSRDINAAMDITAYNAMVDAFARAGDMGAAESMLTRACDFAKRTGLPPPLEAYGAVVSGYVRLKLVDPAVQTVRRFNAAGGTPDVQMLDMLADLCVRTGDFKVAMQAVRSMELIGAEVDKEKYRAIVLRRMERIAAAETQNNGSNRRSNGSGQRSKGKDKNTYLERFKFWLGLPNSYYDDSDMES